jgi:predicted dehydrogenase
MSDTQATLRLALIGAGGISKQHAEGIKTTPGLKCVAICDVREELRQERDRQIGHQSELFADWPTMLKELEGELDAAIVCLPHALHAQAILDCAAAGTHVLCEKPLCTTLDEADEIARALERANVTFMAGHNQLFAPMVKEIKTRLDAGAIGELRWLRSQDCFLHPPGLASSWRGKRASQGGGELIDTGYHPTYTLLHFANSRVARVRATMARFEQPIEGEDTASVQLAFENGVIGEVFTSWAFSRPSGTHKIHLIGSKGQLYGTDNVLFHAPLGGGEPTRIELPKMPTFTAQLAHFAECLRGNAQPLHGVAESREVLQIILAAEADAAGWDAKPATEGSDPSVAYAR